MEDGNQLPSFQSTDLGRVGFASCEKKDPGCLGHIRTYMCVCVCIYLLRTFLCILMRGYITALDYRNFYSPPWESQTDQQS